MPEVSERVPNKDQWKTPQSDNKWMGDAIKAGDDGSQGNDWRIKTVAKRKPHTPEAGGANEVAKRPKLDDINWQLRDLVANSEACYVHSRIHIPTPLVSSKEDLLD
jgi:hypothetical protein